jgi:hypothetical protein
MSTISEVQVSVLVLQTENRFSQFVRSGTETIDPIYDHRQGTDLHHSVLSHGILVQLHTFTRTPPKNTKCATFPRDW